MLLRRTKTNPVFYANELRMLLADEPDRLDRALKDPDSVDFLVWNVFASLDTHSDGQWLAHRLEQLGGSAMRAPVRMAFWTGRERQPLLRPSTGYLRYIRERATARGGDVAKLGAFEQPIEVPVRVETPDVLLLVDATLTAYPLGSGGRDRILELVDAGLEHARRLSKTLAVAMVYKSGTPTAGDLSTRLQQLRDPARLAQQLPFRPQVSPVVLREASWQQLLQHWENEIDYLQLAGQPVRAFLEHCSARGLRR